MNFERKQILHKTLLLKQGSKISPAHNRVSTISIACRILFLRVAVPIADYNLLAND